MEHHFDADEELCYAIVQAVSAFENRRPETLAPLQDSIDIEAVEQLFAPGFEGDPHLTFEYSESHVTIHQSSITVTSAQRERPCR